MGNRLIAVGDIHGCYYTLLDLIEKIDLDVTKDTLVFVGDYIDRGPYSYEVIRYLQNLQRKMGKDNCVCLRGNHEQMAIDADGELTDLRICNGGQVTEWSFRDKDSELRDFVGWFRSLPLVYDTPNILFCHAGLSDPTFEKNTQHDLLWGRDWIMRDSRPRVKQVIFGHTPKENFSPYTTKTGDLCIDSGCVFGGRLSALIIEEDALEQYSRVVMVKRNKKDILTF